MKTRVLLTCGIAIMLTAPAVTFAEPPKESPEPDPSRELAAPPTSKSNNG